MSKYSTDELANALEADFKRPGNSLSRFQVDAICFRLRAADALLSAAKEWKEAHLSGTILEQGRAGARLRAALRKAISAYEEERDGKV